MGVIDKFDGEYRFLSNFWPCKVFLDGIEFNCVENAYQAAKTLDLDERLSFKFLTPGQAKRHGREITLKEDWENIKLEVMNDLVHQKFLDNLELSRELLNTKDNILIERNNWNDTYWGICNGKGENNLGKILMNIRNKLGEMK